MHTYTYCNENTIEQPRASSTRRSDNRAGVASVKAAQKHVPECLRTLEIRIKLTRSKNGKIMLENVATYKSVRG